MVLEQCGKKLHKVLEQYGIKTANLVFEQGVKLELELLVKSCDNELVHVQLWDFAQYSKHLDIRSETTTGLGTSARLIEASVTFSWLHSAGLATYTYFW